jgi:aminoglycoside 3-N-acetyltransferase I
MAGADMSLREPRDTAWRIVRVEATQAGRMHALLDVLADAFEDPGHYSAARPDANWWRRLLAGDGFIALVALVDEQVVGGLAAYVLPKFERAQHEVYLYDLAVAVPHRRRGIATALIHELCAVASRLGAASVYVQADAEDDAAVALYRRLGREAEVLHFDFEVSAANERERTQDR